MKKVISDIDPVMFDEISKKIEENNGGIAKKLKTSEDFWADREGKK